MKWKPLIFLLPLLLFIPSLHAQTDRSQDLGDYVVYYSALPTDILQADVAHQYGISRSKFRGFITVSVQKKTNTASSKPINAEVNVSATNLTGQSKTLSLQRVEEGPAIYYVDDFRIANMETLNFTLKIKPEGSGKNFTVNFRQQFFTN